MSKDFFKLEQLRLLLLQWKPFAVSLFGDKKQKYSESQS